MFTTQIPHTLDPSEGEEDRVIYYVNALPGSGKTYQFDHHLALPHVKNRHNSLLVYAAPTLELLQERERSLLDLGVTRKNLMVISTKDSTVPVVEQFRNAVLGKKGQPGKPNGSIILCTHECVARIQETMKGRERVVLVYDEARACLQDNYALHLPDDVYAYLTEPREHLTEGGKKVKVQLIAKLPVSVSSSENDSSSIYIWNWSNYRIPLPTLAQLQEHLPKTTRQRDRARNILDFLTNIHSSALDVYVSIERKKSEAEYVVSNVFSPSRMFKGFAKVLILSAFFESSQMYQFLTKSNQIDREPLELRNITASYINKKRMVSLLERMRHVYLTYIYDLGGKKRTLSKSEMQQAVVVQRALSPAQIRVVNAKWHELYEKKPESYRTIYDSYLEYEHRGERASDAERSAAYDLMSRLDEKVTIIGGVIPHMVETSIRLQQAFMKRAKLKLESLPVGINPRYNSYKEGDSKIWEDERLDDFNKQTKRFRVPKNGSIITRLPITAHGLNAYQRLHSCAFLAAMKYSNRERDFLKRTIDAYEPETDRTLDYALQLLWRCNVRLPSEEPVLLIVTDRALAKQLQARFHKLAKEWLGEYYAKNDEFDWDQPVLPIVSPKRLLKDYELPTILRYTFNTKEAQRRSNANRKTSVRGQEAAALLKAYRATEEGKRYFNLSNQISYAKRNGKEFAALEAERKTLMTLAQWKLTDDGREAFRKLTKPEETIQEKIRRVLHSIDISKIGDRNERLKIVSAIKNDMPELKRDVKRWYEQVGDNFEHNWKTAEVYGKRYNLGWVVAQAKKYPK
jgi:hypothetical protein